MYIDHLEALKRVPAFPGNPLKRAGKLLFCLVSEKVGSTPESCKTRVGYHRNRKLDKQTNHSLTTGGEVNQMGKEILNPFESFRYSHSCVYSLVMIWADS